MKRRKQSAASAVIEASLGIAAEIAEEKLTTMQARAVERDEVRETLRSKNLANAQRIIQHQYETHGLTDAFNGLLYQYLAFLEVRSMTEREFAIEEMSKKEVTIHNAVSFLTRVDPDSVDRVQNLWAK